MRAAETGHLVFGTLHSANASQAVGRLLDLFPQTEREMVRQTLSLTVKAIISQLLLPCIKKEIDRISPKRKTKSPLAIENEIKSLDSFFSKMEKKKILKTVSQVVN